MARVCNRCVRIRGILTVARSLVPKSLPVLRRNPRLRALAHEAPLRNCFDRTARALEASAVKGAAPTLAHGRRPAMLQFDSGRDEDFRSAVREAAAVHGLLAPSGDAAFMLVSEEECCARETVLQGALTASIVVIALVPLVVFIGRTVVGDARRLLRRKMAGLAFTRTKLRAIVSESLEL